MDAEVNVAAEQLRAAGNDLSKQVPALVKIGEWYLKKAKTTSNAADFTKADALYNAALVRSKIINHEINEDQILQKIVEIYREFLHTFASDDKKYGTDKIRNEIHFHKEFIVNERRKFKDRISKIVLTPNKHDEDKDAQQIHATKIHELCRDIQDMYIRLVSMLAKECENKLGQPPCNYAIIALGSVAGMEATPFSDLEFAILHSDQAIGDKINYFRVLTHFLHLKVINLGETILPAMEIKELNDFQSSDPNGTWFSDAETPRGLSFDGAMPWASKTPLGRMETKNKPALELIRTPEQMAEFQDEDIAVKEGYHLADIMSRATLLYGDEVLLNEYNVRVNKKLNEKSSETEGKCIKTVGVNRGIKQMNLDIETYDPFNLCLGRHCTAGAHFDVKNQFYRLISLLISHLGMIFNIRCPSPWQIISELLTRGIVSVSQSLDMRECLSFVNEIRLRTYFANNRQKELMSPVPQYSHPSQQSPGAGGFENVDQHILVRFLNKNYNIHRQCKEFSNKCILQDTIDSSIFRNAPASFTNAIPLGIYYFRLQNFDEALKCFKRQPKCGLHYVESLILQGKIYVQFGEYDTCIQCFEEARRLCYQNELNADLLKVYNNLASALFQVEKYEVAIGWLKEAIDKHSKIFGERTQTIILMNLLTNLGYAYHFHADLNLALKTLQEAQAMQKELKNVPDWLVASLNINMAETFSELDQYALSIEHMEKGLKHSQKEFGKDNLSIFWAETYFSAGAIYHRCNLNDEAEYYFSRCLELYQRIVGYDPHPGTMSAFNALGVFYLRIHQMEKADENLENALKMARAVNGKKPHVTLALILKNMGKALLQHGKLDESLSCFVEAKEIMDKLLGANHLHPLTSRILYNTGENYLMLGDDFKARQCFENAFKMNCEIYGENSNGGHMEGVCSRLGFTLKKMGSYTEAMEYYTKAIKMAKKIPLTKNNCFIVIFNLCELACINLILEEQNEALKHLEEASNIAKDTGYPLSIVPKYLLFSLQTIVPFKVH